MSVYGTAYAMARAVKDQSKGKSYPDDKKD